MASTVLPSRVSRQVASLLATAMLAGGCATPGPATFSTWQVEAVADDKAVLFAGIPVRTGQIVVSEQGSPNSMFLSLLVAENRPYVHSRILVIEDGRPMVYEANGRMQPSLGNQPLTRNVVGGVRIGETSADLPAVLAVLSSLRDRPVVTDTMCFGELGLTGEIRPVPFGEERLREAQKQGFKRALVPKANVPRKGVIDGIEIEGVSRLSEALDKAS